MKTITPIDTIIAKPRHLDTGNSEIEFTEVREAVEADMSGLRSRKLWKE
jgi:hypothetical protein